MTFSDWLDRYPEQALLALFFVVAFALVLGTFAWSVSRRDD